MISAQARGTDTRNLLNFLALGMLVAALFGAFSAPRLEDFLSYLIVLLAAAAPTIAWLRYGAPGIPVFPVGAALYWMYYGIPALRGVGEREGFSSDQVIVAGFTVATFLGVATIVWTAFLRAPLMSIRGWRLTAAFDDRNAILLIFVGLAMGMIFHVMFYTGLYGAFGNASGVVRAVLLAPTLLACYLMGYARAKISSSQYNGIYH